MFQVYRSGRAEKEFNKLEDGYRKRIEDMAKILETDPVPVKLYDVKKMRGLANTFRIRIGKIRILYGIYWEEKVIVIAKIEPRESAYD